MNRAYATPSGGASDRLSLRGRSGVGASLPHPLRHTTTHEAPECKPPPHSSTPAPNRRRRAGGNPSPRLSPRHPTRACARPRPPVLPRTPVVLSPHPHSCTGTSPRAGRCGHPNRSLGLPPIVWDFSIVPSPLRERVRERMKSWQYATLGHFGYSRCNSLREDVPTIESPARFPGGDAHASQPGAYNGPCCVPSCDPWVRGLFKGL